MGCIFAYHRRSSDLRTSPAAKALRAWKVGANVYTEAMQFSTDVSANTHLLIARLLGGEQSDVFGIHLGRQGNFGTGRRIGANWLCATANHEAGGLTVGAAFTAALFLVLLFLFFSPRARTGASACFALAPPEYRPAIGAFAAQAHPIMLRYVRGLLVIVVFTAVGCFHRLGHPLFHAGDLVLLLGVASGNPGIAA